MAISPREIISMVWAFLFIGILFPLGLVYLGSIDAMQYSVNGSIVKVIDVVDAGVLSLLTTIVPIVGVLGLVMGFLPRLTGN